MKCIKDKCKYYSEHDFMASIGICSLGTNFKNEGDVDCIISRHISELQGKIKRLKEYIQYIEKY